LTTVSVPADVEHFREIVGRRFGLRFDDTRLAQLAEVLERRLELTRERPGAYLSRIDSPGLAQEEARAVVGELTVSETYFFRNIEQFRALADVALPARMGARSDRRRLRILSAGCASGEEAYSIAMVVRDLPGLAGWEVSIQGVDVSAAMIDKAAHGRYSAWSLRETPPDVQKRLFHPDGRELVLDPAVRNRVTFLERNLVEDDEALWPRETFDVVFCRNVLMYLTAEAARGVVLRISRSLAPGGFLFLGHAETLRGLSRDFHLQHTHETFYYRRREAHELANLDATEPAPDPARAPRGDPLAVIATDDSWVENIRRASERIQALTRASSAAFGRSTPAPVAARATGERTRADLVGAVDLLRSERYAEAQAMLGQLPQESARDPDALLLKAVLLTHGGDLGMAEEVCRELLERDEMNAGAHYLTALCREDAGARRSAAEHDQLAAYLDPTFAMPRLHLGLLARRAGDQSAARRELEQALALLDHEEASRLLLFGGGFSRDALAALCRAELARCEGPR
jgi:chemotaxis protein methyltransferase CheR